MQAQEALGRVGRNEHICVAAEKGSLFTALALSIQLRVDRLLLMSPEFLRPREEMEQMQREILSGLNILR